MFLDVSTVEERKHTVCLQSSRCSTTLSTIRIAGTESAEHFLASKWRNKKRERERGSTSLFFKEANFVSESTQQRLEISCLLLYSVDRWFLIQLSRVSCICWNFCRDEREDAEEKKFLGNWKFDEDEKKFSFRWQTKRSSTTARA